MLHLTILLDSLLVVVTFILLILFANKLPIRVEQRKHPAVDFEFHGEVAELSDVYVFLVGGARPTYDPGHIFEYYKRFQL